MSTKVPTTTVTPETVPHVQNQYVDQPTLPTLLCLWVDNFKYRVSNWDMAPIRPYTLMSKYCVDHVSGAPIETQPVSLVNYQAPTKDVWA
jgi:hypothetical protein